MCAINFYGSPKGTFELFKTKVPIFQTDGGIGGGAKLHGG